MYKIHSWKYPSISISGGNIYMDRGYPLNPKLLSMLSQCPPQGTWELMTCPRKEHTTLEAIYPLPPLINRDKSLEINLNFLCRGWTNIALFGERIGTDIEDWLLTRAYDAPQISEFHPISQKPIKPLTNERTMIRTKHGFKFKLQTKATPLLPSRPKI